MFGLFPSHALQFKFVNAAEGAAVPSVRKGLELLEAVMRPDTKSFQDFKRLGEDGSFTCDSTHFIKPQNAERQAQTVSALLGEFLQAGDITVETRGKTVTLEVPVNGLVDDEETIARMRRNLSLADSNRRVMAAYS